MAIPTEDDFLTGDNNTIIEPIKHEYKTATIVDKDTNVNEIIPYLSGYDWKVNYYNQVKAEDDLLSNLDEQAPASLQQYTSIENLILKVQTAIDVTNINDINGTSILYGNIVPQVEDLFTVHIAGNRLALFRVTNVNKKHYSLSPIFEIDYVVDTFVDTNPDRYNDLQSKIVKELYFDENYVVTESSPLLLKSSYELKQDIEKFLHIIPEYYTTELMDNESRIIKIPGTDYIDLGLQDFFNNIVTIKDSLHFGLVNMPGNNLVTDTDTIYNQLLSRDKRFLKLSNGNGYITEFNGRLMNGTSAREDSQVLLQMKYLGLKGIFGPSNTEQASDLEWTEASYASEYTNIVPTKDTLNGNYLFTDDFYNNITSDIVLEKMVISYLNNENLTQEHLDKILNTYRYWSKTEKYFYLPITILLFKYAIRNIHNVIY